jgi:glutaconyl-CoA/methylmalonyl-CoA decarboxylase subunit gamma
MIYNLKIAEKSFKVEIGDIGSNPVRVVVNGLPYSVKIEKPEGAGVSPKAVETTSQTVQAAAPPPKPAARESKSGAGALTAPIPGLILEIKVNVGDSVSQGQVVAIMEAMKMENDLLAPISGTVQEILSQKGTDVSTGDVIMVIA